MKRASIYVADYTCDYENRAFFYKALEKYGIRYVKSSWQEYEAMRRLTLLSPFTLMGICPLAFGEKATAKWVHVWDNSPYSHSLKPGINDYFVALETSKYSSVSQEYIDQISNDFDEEAQKEICLGKPHVFVVKTDTLEGMRELEYALYGNNIDDSLRKIMK